MQRLSLLFAFALAADLSAQGTHPKRPRLPSDADTNDAAVYFAWGSNQAQMPNEAGAAFYWAERLDPSESAYLLARYRAIWTQQTPQWRRWYLAGNKSTLSSKPAKLLDSLEERLRLRDPFPQLPLEYCYKYPEIARMGDGLTRALVYFDVGCHREAALEFETALAEHPEEVEFRLWWARALVTTDRYADAAVQVQIVLDSLRARDAATLRYGYESKEYLEYVIAEVHRRRRDYRAAVAGYGRALAENLGFYPAHVRLAELARQQKRPFEAAREYAAALEAGGDHAVLHHDYGVVLLENGNPAEAETHLRRALELEPYWASAHFHLARALDTLGRGDDAGQRYRTFLTHAAKKMVKLRGEAEARLTALGGTP